MFVALSTTLALAQTPVFSYVNTSFTTGIYGYLYSASTTLNTKVYFTPLGADDIAVYDSTTSSFYTIPIPVRGTFKYSPGVAIGSTIYYTPFSQPNIGVHDTTTDSFTYVNISTSVDTATHTTGDVRQLSGPFQFSGAGAIGPIIYMSPWNSEYIGIYDTSTSTFSTVDTGFGPTPGIFKYNGVAAVGTTVVIAPSGHDSVGILDSTTNAFSYVNTSDQGVTGPDKYASNPAVAVGSTVFFTPASSDTVGMFDVSTMTFSTIPTTGVTGGFKYAGAALYGTRIYYSPFRSDTIGVVDTATKTFTYIPMPYSGEFKHSGASMVGNTVVFAPTLINRVGFLTIPNPSCSAGDVCANGLSCICPYTRRLLFGMPSTPVACQCLP